MSTMSLRPTRLPLTDAQRTANRALTDGERDILRELAQDSAPAAGDLADMDDEERYQAEREAEAENDRWIADGERAAQDQWLHRYDDGSEFALTEEF